MDSQSPSVPMTPMTSDRGDDRTHCSRRSRSGRLWQKAIFAGLAVLTPRSACAFQNPLFSGGEQHAQCSLSPRQTLRWRTATGCDASLTPSVDLQPEVEEEPLEDNTAMNGLSSIASYSGTLRQQDVPSTKAEAPELLEDHVTRNLAIEIQTGVALQNRRSELEQELGRSPVVGEWARATGMSCDALLSMIRRSNRARDKLVTSNLRLVNSVVTPLLTRSRSLTHQDLMQEGTLGLIRAAEKFDAHRDTKFSTYAYFWIRAAVLRAIQDHNDLIRLPGSQHERLSRVMSVRRQLSMQQGSEPSDELLADKLGITARELRRRFDLLSSQGKTYDLSEHWTNLPASEIETRVMDADLREDIGRVLERHLRPQELLALQLRFGLDGRTGSVRSMAEVGVIMHLSKERIRQLVQGALRKLRSLDLHDYLEAA